MTDFKTTVKPQRAVPRLAISLPTNGGANQADAAGADINTIVAQYKKNGTMPNVARTNPLYGDFTFPEDIHSMFEAVAQSRDRFMQLPADVRTAAANSEEEFLEMYKTAEGQKKLVDAGLIITDQLIPTNTPEPPPPDPVPVQPTPSTEETS